jgi:long-chain acyl-CoA synthetase
MTDAAILVDIPGRFRSIAADRGEAACVLEDAGALTFRELDRRSDAMAAGLAARGVGPGDRLGLLCPNGRDFVVAYLGSLKAGATLVPLNLLLHPREMGFILADSGALGLIHHQAFDTAAAQALEGLNLRLRVRIGGMTLARPATPFPCQGSPETQTRPRRHWRWIRWRRSPRSCTHRAPRAVPRGPC